MRSGLPPRPVTPRPGPSRGWLSREEGTHLEERFGDLLLSLCRLARWLGLNAEDSLRAAAGRFAGRLRTPERPPPRPSAT